ncbi:MAG: hypothetical protein AAF806_08030 [Bacteroidota bacterium]
MTTTAIKAKIQELNRVEQAEIARYIIDLMSEANVESAEISKDEEYQKMKSGMIEAFEEVKILKKNKHQRITLNEFLDEC